MPLLTVEAFESYEFFRVVSLLAIFLIQNQYISPPCFNIPLLWAVWVGWVGWVGWALLSWTCEIILYGHIQRMLSRSQTLVPDTGPKGRPHPSANSLVGFVDLCI